LSSPQARPGFSQSRLDLTGENVTELTRKIATNQPVLAWLHSPAALALYNDPYIQAALNDPVGAVASIYQLQDPEGTPVGQQYLDALYEAELGHPVGPEDFPVIAADLYNWLEGKITAFRGLEMVKYLSAADSAEKLIAGSIIQAATEAVEKHAPKDLDTPDLGHPTLNQQLQHLKEEAPELYELLLAQLQQAARGAGSTTPNPQSQPCGRGAEREGEAAET